MHCCLKNKPTEWDFVSSQAEPAYKSSANKSTGMSPFCICTGYGAPTTLDLDPLPPMFFAYSSALKYSHHIKEVHEQVCNILVDT